MYDACHLSLELTGSDIRPVKICSKWYLVTEHEQEKDKVKQMK